MKKMLIVLVVLLINGVGLFAETKVTIRNFHEVPQLAGSLHLQANHAMILLYYNSDGEVENVVARAKFNEDLDSMTFTFPDFPIAEAYDVRLTVATFAGDIIRLESEKLERISADEHTMFDFKSFKQSAS